MKIKTRFNIGDKVKTPDGIGTISEIHIKSEGIFYWIEEKAWAYPQWRIKEIELPQCV
jgi:hypothetical protein